MNQQKNYDSEFCGSLPLHLINQIQPYGALIVLSKVDLTIIQVSENIEKFTGFKHTDVVKQQIKRFISEDSFSELQSKSVAGLKGKVSLRLTFNETNISNSLLAICHQKDSYLLLEIERLEEDEYANRPFSNVYGEVRSALERINTAETVLEVCAKATEELKKLSGFDKIMIYRFDKDWNGEVIAEEMEAKMESYIGLRFPASDIPKQARGLYLQNPYRLIPTRDYTPVKIYPVINPVSGGFIDMSGCNLRSVPAVHLEYLKNMDVMASMSTAIIKDGELWGLISCHHRTEKHVSFDMCSVFELLSGIISSRIHAIAHQHQLQVSGQLHSIMAKLMEQVYVDDDTVRGITSHNITVLDLLQCTGAAVLYNKQYKTIGDVPDRYQVKELVLWLQGQNIEKLFTISSLSVVHEAALAYSNIGSGIIVLPIHAGKGEYVIGFRPEIVQTVSWGGNPNEAINFETNGVSYHPRNSFNIWQQTVSNTAARWTDEVLQTAEAFRNFLIESALKKVYDFL